MRRSGPSVLPWPRDLPAELPWGERAMAATYVSAAIRLSLWAPPMPAKGERRARSGGA